MIKFFRKTTITPMVEFLGDNATEIFNFTKGAFNISDNTISTSEGIMKVTVGDWVAQDSNGKFYPIKNDVKEKSYKEADIKIGTKLFYILKCEESFERGYFTKAEIYLNSIRDYVSADDIECAIERIILEPDNMSDNHIVKGILTICRNNSEYHKFLPQLIEFGVSLINDTDLDLFELIADCIIDNYISDITFQNKILNKIKSENPKDYIQNYIKSNFKI
jgi:hypothetical protein